MRFIWDAVLNNAGAAFASQSLIVNGLYDVDPAFLTTAVPGFTELMALYRNYRVDSTKITLSVTNKEAFPIHISEAFTSNQIYAANAYRPNLYGNKFSRQYQLSEASGMDRVKIVNQANMAALFGSSAYWGDVNNFLGTSATNPGTLLGWAIGIDSPTPLVNGVSIFGELEFICEFSNLRLFIS